MSLRAEGLHKTYDMDGGQVRTALAGVSIEVRPGQTVGVVGESGCGKSTLARMLVRLDEPTSGTVCLDGDDVTHSSARYLRAFRSAVQLVFQDPYASLNPRRSVEQTLDEVLHARGTSRHTTRDLLDMVGLDQGYAARYPHELSGGQRQRVGIARALAADPTYLVLDEPVSALDVSVRAEIMNLLVRLRDDLGLGYLFISHDLSMVRYISDTVSVMYLGRIVEEGAWRAVLDRPEHPYSQGLRRAVPAPRPVDGADRHAVSLQGDVPDPLNVPAGCEFCPRCPSAEAVCVAERPALVELDAGHWASCHVAARRRGPTTAEAHSGD